MKHSIKRISKSALSVILALMMVVSTMVVGIVTTSAATITSDGTMILYYDPTPASASTWNDKNANTYIHFVKEDNTGVWSNIGTKIDNDHAYVTVPEGTFKELLLVRFDPNDTGAPDWTHWGKTDNITIDNTKNYITDFGYNSKTATWSTYGGSSGSGDTKANYYLRGTYNDWKTGIQMDQSSDNTFAYTKVTGNGTFKICNDPDNWNCTEIYGGQNFTNSPSNITNIVNLNDQGGNDHNCQVQKQDNVEFYILLLYKKTKYNNTDNNLICATTTLPSASSTYSITVTQPSQGGTIKVTDTNGNTISDLTAVPKDKHFKVVADTTVAGWIFSSATVMNGSDPLIPDAEGVYTMPAANVTVTATYTEKSQYAVTASASNASVKITDNNGTDITQAYEGDTVKVNVTPNPGYECNGTYTVTPAGLSVSYSNNVFTFTMPGEAVTLIPNVVARTEAKVTVSSNNNVYGTAELLTTGKIYVGDTFDVTVTPVTNYALKEFTISGCTQGAKIGRAHV